MREERTGKEEIGIEKREGKRGGKVEGRSEKGRKRNRGKGERWKREGEETLMGVVPVHNRLKSPDGDPRASLHRNSNTKKL